MHVANTNAIGNHRHQYGSVSLERLIFALLLSRQGVMQPETSRYPEPLYAERSLSGRGKDVSEQLRVMVTGATGKIGQTLMEDLSDTYILTGTSRTPQADPRFRVLAFDDIDALTDAFRGQDAIVHMHAKSNHDTDVLEPYLQPNVVGVYHAFEAARRAGVPRFVFASSNHATGWYELAGERCDAESTPRPDGLYGVAKVWGEALGRYYSDRFGMEVVALRIGSYQYRQQPPAFSMGARILSSWLSARDLVQLVRRSVEAPGIKWGIYYGISANARATWDITNAITELGYRPQDNAEDYADEVLARAGQYELWGHTSDGMR